MSSDSEPRRPSGRRLRVLLLIKCLDHGGAERLLVDVASQADRAEFDYEAAYVLDSDDGLAEAMRSTGTPVRSLGARGNWDLSWLRALRRMLVAGRYDVVHVHLPYAAAFSRFITWTLPARHRPKFIYTEHNEWDKTAAPIRWLNRIGIRGDDALVAVSGSVRDALPADLRDRAIVVVHGVDRSNAPELVRRRSEVRDEVRRELEVPDGHALVLTVANLRRQKAYDVLLEASRILFERDVPVSVIAAGEGPLKEELTALHQSLGLGDRFKFLGQREDALRLMTACDLFVLSSSYEGLPVALMEASSVGSALVMTAVGEIPNIITDGVDGLLVAPGDPRGLADAIAQLVHEPGLRAKLGAEAMDLSAQFDVGHSTRKLEQLYREVTAR